MKIVINRDYGGFQLKKVHIEYILNKYNIVDHDFYLDERNSPILVDAVENSNCDSSLKVVEIPDDIDWEIKEYDGMEWVAEKHRIWY